MNKKIIILAVVVIIAAAVFIAISNKTNKTANTGNTTGNVQNNTAGEVVPAVPEAEKPVPVTEQAAVKEFSMTSFVEMVDGQPKPQYSLKEITVKQGDKVRLKITVTKGAHNFNLDEFNVKADTPLNQEVAVEFTADKAGEFIYYCSMPGHRANGHWGTLKVLTQ